MNDKVGISNLNLIAIDDLISTYELSSRLVYDACRDGSLKSYKVGTKYFAEPSAIETWIKTFPKAKNK